MKKIVFILSFVSIFLISCNNNEAGTTNKVLNGDEKDLPEELKNLVVYNVYDSDGTIFKVALLNNNVNSITNRSGKINRTTFLLNNSDDEKIIRIKSIISENDSIIVARK